MSECSCRTSIAIDFGVVKCNATDHGFLPAAAKSTLNILAWPRGGVQDCCQFAGALGLVSTREKSSKYDCVPTIKRAGAICVGLNYSYNSAQSFETAVESSSATWRPCSSSEVKMTDTSWPIEQLHEDDASEARLRAGEMQSVWSVCSYRRTFAPGLKPTRRVRKYLKCRGLNSLWISLPPA